MIESHDSHDESSAESPVRGKDEEPTEAHGGDESQQAGGGGSEGMSREETHKPPEREADE